MKLDSGAQMKDLGERIGDLPTLRQIPVQIHVYIANHQAIENEAVNALRDPFCGIPRIQIRRIRLSHEHHFARRAFASAATAERQYRSALKKRTDACQISPQFTDSHPNPEFAFSVFISHRFSPESRVDPLPSQTVNCQAGDATLRRQVTQTRMPPSPLPARPTWTRATPRWASGQRRVAP
jgi:hypothetical protein